MKACVFDEDPVGAILEYVLLQEQYECDQVAAGKAAWVAANISPDRPEHDVWTGRASSRRHLHIILNTHRYPKRRRELDRVFAKLEAEQLIDRWSGDSNLNTDYRIASDLGKELFRDDSYREYLFGPSYIVRRWRDSIVKIVHPTESGIGTGFLVEGNRVATADHVLDELPEFLIKTDDGRTIRHGQPIRPSKELDIDVALIPLEEEFDRRPFILATDCDLLDSVIVFGYPPISHTDDAYLVVNRGEVSALPKTIRGGQRNIVISCLLRGGDSGGPVVNRRGGVVGIVSRSLFRKVAETEESVNESLGMAAASESDNLKFLMSDD